jgi:branched-chain amino acid transport system ATP-binding protein
VSTKEGRGKAHGVLEVVGLDGRKSEKAANLTLTGRKRLELAKALANDPEILFLDEVMAGLSLKEMDETIELISAINQRGITIVVVEHVMRAIMSVSDRIIVLHHGRKIADGAPKKIVNDDSVIAAYLGQKYADMKKRDTLK